MVSFQLTAEQQQLRDTVGQFAREVSPEPAAGPTSPAACAPRPRFSACSSPANLAWAS